MAITLLTGTPTAEATAGTGVAAAAHPTSAPASEVPTAIEGSWSWPVAAPHPVLREFSMTSPYGAGHRGIDLGVAPGAVIAAPANGIVRFAGTVVDRGVLSIEHENGTISSFEPVDPSVSTGERVERGQLVATVSTSITHSPDGGLHVGARVEGDYFNPLLLLGELPPAVLLPIGEAGREADSPPSVSTTASVCTWQRTFLLVRTTDSTTPS